MNDSGKNKEFVKGVLKLWIISIVLFFTLNLLSSQIVSENMSGFLSDISGVIFMFGICGLPIILFCSLLVTITGKLVDKIPTKNE